MEKHTVMTTNSQKTQKLRVSKLDTQKATQFDLAPSPSERKGIAAQLGLQGLRKLRFYGQISATGSADWGLIGDLGATVVQTCVLTLEPVSTRIDVAVERQFLAKFDTPGNDDEETEIIGDENSEALSKFIDLHAIMLEALSLALPLYPKIEGATLNETIFAKEGVKPMSDEDARPFGALSALRDQLKKET